MNAIKIGNRDFSDHIIAGSYQVNKKDVFNSWTDANGIEHREVIRRKVTGSFDMIFKTISSFASFSSTVESSRRSDGSVAVVVDVNNTGETNVDADVFISFEPVRNRDGLWRDYMERYTVTIEER